MKTGIMNTLSGVVSKVGFGLKKRSPELLMATGLVSAVAGTVLACKATIKATEVVSDAKDTMEKIHECAEKGVAPDGTEYTKDVQKRDTTLVYIQTGVKLAKLYAPAIGLGAVAVVSVLASNNILKKRNVALAAAYAAVDKQFKGYRTNAIERFGEEVDKQLLHGIKEKEITEKVVNEETGEESEVTVRKFVGDASGISGYARIFQKYTDDEKGNPILNPHYESNNDYNLMFIKSQESYANDLLKAKKRLFLNEVYEMLGFPPTKAGQVVGWMYDPKNPNIDNYIDFGNYEASFIDQDRPGHTVSTILLDFNVDGNIWEKM